MFTRLAMVLVGTAALAWVGTVAQEKADKADTLAKEATVQFAEAMKAENIEAVMKIVDIPFFWDGVKNIKDREELKEAFAEVFAEKDLTQLEYTIKEIHTVAKVLENFSEKERKLLREVVDKDDRIVLVWTKRDGIAVVVRIRQGKAKVVGFRD